MHPTSLRSLLLPTVLITASSPLAIAAQAPATANAATAVKAVAPHELRESAKLSDKIERALEGKGDLNWDKVIPDLEESRARIEAYLGHHPRDVGALILKVRQGMVLALLEPMQVNLSEDDTLGATADPYVPLNEALDRVIALEPRLAEAYYWKARISATQIPRFVDGTFQMVADWDQAAVWSSRAVELAPESVRVRELLALALAQQGATDRALEVIGSVEGGKHLLAMILKDFKGFPLPASAVALPERAQTFAQMFAVDARARFGPQRVRAYLVPGPASELAAFFKAQWPTFELRSDDGDGDAGSGEGPRAFTQFLEPKGSGWTPAKTSKNTDFLSSKWPDKGIQMVVMEWTAAAEAVRGQYPSTVELPEVFCELVLLNFRQ